MLGHNPLAVTHPSAGAGVWRGQPERSHEALSRLPWELLTRPRPKEHQSGQRGPGGGRCRKVAAHRPDRSGRNSAQRGLGRHPTWCVALRSSRSGRNFRPTTSAHSETRPSLAHLTLEKSAGVWGERSQRASVHVGNHHSKPLAGRSHGPELDPACSTALNFEAGEIDRSTLSSDRQRRAGSHRERWLNGAITECSRPAGPLDTRSADSAASW